MKRAILYAVVIIGVAVAFPSHAPRPGMAIAGTCRQTLDAGQKWRCAFREQRHAIWREWRAARWLGQRLDLQTGRARAYGPLAALRAENHRLRWLVRERKSALAQWPASVVCRLPWAGGCARALAITRCEDPSGDPHRVSATDDHGLFQIHRPTWQHASWMDWSRIYDALYNTMAAFRISNGGRDWSAWTCSRLT